MSRKGLYLAVGFLWATLLGVGAGLAAAAFAAGAAWIYLFGDATWPDWTNWAIPGVGVVIGLLTFMGSMVVTRVVANRHDTAGGERRAENGGGAIAWFLLLLGLAVAGTIAWQQIGRRADIEVAQEQAVAAARYFPVMLSETHRIETIAVEWPGGGQDGRAVVTLDGVRDGDYRLDWQIRDTAFARPLLMSKQTLRLTAGTHALDFALPAQRVVDGYRGLLNRQDANVMVDEPFVFEVELAPVPSDDELSRMPANEVQNLANGWSSLIQRSRTEFAVRFILNGDRLSWE